MPNAIVFFSAPKMPPGLTANTSRTLWLNPDPFLLLRLRGRAVDASAEMTPRVQ